MISVSLKKLNGLKNNFKGKRIAVIGDLMLDCYFWGAVSRISPEAPVPVVEVDEEFYRFGGAMNVAYNIQTLGGVSFPIGVIGNDNEGKLFRGLLNKTGITDKGIVVDRKRPTTAKTRVIANKQHVVRIDKEKTHSISAQTENKILGLLKKQIKNIDAVILQDYNKGVMTERLIKEVVTICTKAKKIVTVDPKFNNFFTYQSVTVFKPNRKEAEDVLGIRINTDADITNAGLKLLEKLNCKYALLTLGEKGIALFEKGKPERRIPTKARKVSDVSGAGDTVISTLTMALTAGADIYDAAYLANYAGGLVCQEVGIVPIELNNLFNAVADELR
ncbi:MAG: D-glycero-beta-D-manno-heptose-7-phosphate kinase [Bacteroidetes bacterium]|nr:D-glycero-beta-D-manno-heptose-7-phosphate kinase [Bacteroidota bacterium]